MMPAVQAAVKRTEGLNIFWYGNFLHDEGGVGEGWTTCSHHPRFGCNYRGLTNRLDLLLEAYSYISFKERVEVTYVVLREALQYVAAHANEIVQLLDQCKKPPAEVAIRYRTEAIPGQTVEILTREPYALDGAAVSADVPHLAYFVPTALVQPPWGYAMPQAAADYLQGHGPRIADTKSGTTLEVEVPVMQERVTEAATKILEAQANTYWLASHERTHRSLPEGWRVVSTEQPYGAIAVYACEVESDDGVIANGMVPEPVPGQELPVWRVLQAL